MAAQYLTSHGVDVDAIMSKIQFDDDARQGESQEGRVLSSIVAARLPCQGEKDSLWDIAIANGLISAIERNTSSTSSLSHLSNVLDAHGQLLAPSLCHAHVHLDKCFLLQYPKYSDLTINKGDFSEAMQLGGKAKEKFERDDLIARGSRLIEESPEAGVTALRAFVEVDEVVEMKCVDAAVELRQKYSRLCEIQICAFAQLAIFSGQDEGARRRELMRRAMHNPHVHVLGSTPYVEKNQNEMQQNIEWLIEKAIETKKHIDFHLDYNLDKPELGVAPMIWHVLNELKRQQWITRNHDRTICLGHCTRLTLFKKVDLEKLKQVSQDLPVAFIGLPTSDLYMMDRPESDQETQGVRQRGTLQIPHMIEEYNFNGAISINNVGNAFTPFGNCDPLALVSFGVGLYHAGTQKDTEVLYECISTRAKRAIGLGNTSLKMRVGDVADFVLIGSNEKDRLERKTISEVVYDAGRRRQTIYRGTLLTL